MSFLPSALTLDEALALTSTLPQALALLGLASAGESTVAAPDLGRACRFLIFATSAITTGDTGYYRGDVGELILLERHGLAAHLVATRTGISPASIDAVTIPPGLEKVTGEDYYTAYPQVTGGFVYPPGNVTDPAHSDMLSAYDYANSLPVTGAVDDRSTVLGGQTFTKGVYRWSAPACSSSCFCFEVFAC